MKSISKADQQRLQDLQDKLADAASDVDTEFTELAGVIEKINNAIAAYNTIVAETNGVIEDIANELESYIGERSEKWQESDAGDAAGEWLSELQNAALEDVELLEFPELPEGLDQHGGLENIPLEAN